ncbi:DUF3427 domain-containing protein [Haloimpatiens sp. FM7330]|uniref:DEAD/DEAH box helicase n=1 Tax=Haloimpatiens sp. FM7330 TaxID=3298610 RepID=UPI0036281959
MKGVFMELKNGLYEQVINELIENKINELGENHKFIDKKPIDKAEGGGVFAQYLRSVIKKALSYLKKGRNEEETLLAQIDLCNKLVELMKNYTNEDSLEDYKVDLNGEMLFSISDKINNIKPPKFTEPEYRPITPLGENSLFTGAKNEPDLGSEFRKEIRSADRIDILVSFIRWSGIRMIMDELKEFTETKKIRIITTSYMGATEYKAIEFLANLPNTEVKISYDTKRTRLHAKAYYFHRESGFSTAYIGSSNISNPAMSSGLEWNMKLSEQTSKDILAKFTATFDAYWNDREFYTFNPQEEESKIALKTSLEYIRQDKEVGIKRFNFDIKPYFYQKEILDKLQVERKVHNRYKNLVVAATGTGKTVISAFDYKRFCEEDTNKQAKLLFVAHRKEILEQSRECFRAILKDYNFGDLCVGEHTPEKIDHLFISIQSFNSKEFIKNTSEDFYDFIIIDEFHHAAASSYQDLLNYYKPKVLLGLTATPERMDEKSVLEYFDNKIAAEIRLGEAINKKLLCPFHYFGVADCEDLSNLKWSRGGYLKEDLEKVYTKNNQRAELVVRNIGKYVNDINKVKGLGFCVSKKHADFMSDYFNHIGMKSISLNSESSIQERNKAKHKLVKGEIKFIFVVDLYNEGVDIPEVNTVLFLRPTESLTVFLQQLGRGLRLSDNKECLTVLDFVGQAHANYNFEQKFRALIGKTKDSTDKEIKNEFPNLPKGCHIYLEKVAQEYILNNLKKSLINKNTLKSKIRNFANVCTEELNINNFIDYYNLSLEDIYKRFSFNRLCVEAGVKEDFQNLNEKELTKAFSRLLHINSMTWINFIINVLENIETIEVESFNEEEKRMLLMFHYTVWVKVPSDLGFNTLKKSILAIKENKEMYEEMLQILKINKEKIDFLEKKVNLGIPSPLELHCQYSRDEILSALGYYTENKKPSQREGVKYFKKEKIDAFFITLNKSERDYSPSTMYEDYAISENLFHWQSQSTTSVESQTGQRYINHRKTGNKILLFVREYNKVNGITSSYYFLGTANYISHRGDRPISFTFRLDNEMPVKLLNKASKVI